MTTVMLAAGGTGGHVIPALTVARLLKARRPAWTCVAVSGQRGMPERLWDASVVTLETVPTQPWPRGLELVDVRYWWRQGVSAVRIARLLKRHRPGVVVGFGGYVAGPTVMLAKLLGIPTVIHEQNVFPGRTTRLLVRWADRVAVSFEETRRHLPSRAAVTVTGNPVRPEVEGHTRAAAAKSFELSPSQPILLITGGSQGSHCLNEVSVEALARLTPAQRRMFQVIHLTGPHDGSWVTERYRSLGITARVHPFLSTMGPAYAAATLVVARAGATTVAELVATATPSVLVPYPHAGAHQAVNAQWLARHAGALVLDQAVFTPERFLDVIVPLLTDPERLQAMRAALSRLATPGAAERMADTVAEVAHAA